ncbi:MAG: cytochrome c maturation protein CcmE [Limnochordales bacterium]|nr:cytochrome c maturation protein CcmE [Limnochordales bacterium]
METKRWVVLVFMVVALLYLVATGWQSVPYMSVSQLVATPERWQERLVRVRGELVAQNLSHREDSRSGLIVMVLRDGGAELVAHYRGELPTKIELGDQLVAEGRLAADGVLRAERILVECPSRYIPDLEEDEKGGEESGT